MVFEPVPFLYTALSSAFMWIVLAGFLVLPTTFPNIQTILKESEELSKVLHVARNLPLYVPSFSPSCLPSSSQKEAPPALYSF
jgi:hypothetical protein